MHIASRKTFRSTHPLPLRLTKVTITVNCIFHPERAFHTRIIEKLRVGKNEDEQEKIPFGAIEERK